ncbi:type II toxin-antitoxin system VapC family toxin [Paraliomyxa miuraensis]|uniref:type II toxin-antitoxin system VapC family toxin n=1 Tax=Paraliomyxa miuraensis TaxID=376150 RepID=UPI002254D120|nr:type II toxin-antitoxin system VapC family toxin [Paraliomyxa miuraensis]MCX4244723.1 type II toxin-antitoxin system VapC family toxin [Paraliomyxa miuraensis]
MRLLLDTCALLWLVDDVERLSARARQLLDDETHEVFVSVVSYWEVVLKVHRGRLELPCPPKAWFDAAVDRDAILSIEAADVTELCALQAGRGHKDPFDRMLVATARRRGLTIVTADAAFVEYDVAVVW